MTTSPRTPDEGMGGHTTAVYRYEGSSLRETEVLMTGEDQAVTMWVAILLDDGGDGLDVKALYTLSDWGVSMAESRERAVQMLSDPRFQQLVGVFTDALTRKPILTEEDVEAAIA